LEAKGEKKGRVYHFSAMVYRQLKVPEAYVRAHGIDPVRQEGMVIEYLHAHGKITSQEIQELLGITRNQERYVAQKMLKTGKIKMAGKPPAGAYYLAAS
jgi:ATP-dependent DNA helicase RecG